MSNEQTNQNNTKQPNKKSLTTKRKPILFCEYCLVGKTTRLFRCEDGADYPCCKDCYQEVVNFND